MNQKHVSVLLIYDNSFLVLKRGKTAPWMPGKYCFPGGKVEQDENPSQAALRETLEETNIELDNLHGLVIDNKTMFYSLMKHNNVELNYEHTEYNWIKLSELDNYNFVPGCYSIIKRAIEFGLLC